MWRVGWEWWRGWEQRVEGGRGGGKRGAAVVAAECGAEGSCDLIGYLIGFVWICAVFVMLDGEWSGL